MPLDFKLPELLNPFKSMEGFYQIPICIRGALKPHLDKQTIEQVVSIVDYMRENSVKAKPSSILEYTSIPSDLLSKIGGIVNKPPMETWEITCDPQRIRDMGNSTHWRSCYATTHKNIPVAFLQHSVYGLALFLRKDNKGDLLERFLVASESYPGSLEAIGTFKTKNSNLKLKVGNYKGHRSHKYPNTVLSLLEDQGIKLTSEEEKEFKW